MSVCKQKNEQWCQGISTRFLCGASNVSIFNSCSKSCHLFREGAVDYIYGCESPKRVLLALEAGHRLTDQLIETIPHGIGEHSIEQTNMQTNKTCL